MPRKVVYLSLGLRLTYDDADIVREVEVFAPAQVSLGQIELLGRMKADLEVALASQGTVVSEPDALILPGLGISVWFPDEDGPSASVVIHDAASPPPVPSKNEILRALGLKPL